MNKICISKKTERNTGIEMVRIIAIFCVVLSHFCVHSNFEFPGDRVTLNHLLIQMGGIGEIGVTLFVLISGYFSVKQKQSVRKLVYLVLQIWIYNAAILLVAVILKVRFDVSSIIRYIVPIYNTHWFAYVYLVLFIMMPYINKFLLALDKDEYTKFLLIVGMMWSVIYTFTGADLNFSYLVWFIYLYMIGAYIRLYSEKRTSWKRWALRLIVCLSMLFLSTVVIDLLGLCLGFYPANGTHFYSLQSPLILGSAVAIFQLFRLVEIKSNKYVNAFAGTTFAIYLISDHPIVRNWLWNTLFSNGRFSDSWYLVLLGLSETVVVCLACALIDMLRKELFSTRIAEKTIGFISNSACCIFKAVRQFFVKHI